MRKSVLAALLLSTFAIPALAQVTLQVSPSGVRQQGDPRDQQSDDQRDRQRDEQRDAERDAQRDRQRDRQRDAQRDAERDRQHDAERRAEYQQNRDRYDDRRNQQQIYGYNGRDTQRDWRYDGNRYAAAAYVYPQGGRYQPRAAGDYLSRAYRTPQRYWITDPGAYRLAPPAQGTRWVRVGPDALMVQIADGIIASAVLGLFN